MLPPELAATSQDIIQVADEFYILATSSLADDRTRVLKDGDTFAVFDRYGDVQPIGLGEQGLYHAGTRFLSHLEFRLGETRPLLLSSTVHEESAFLTVDLTNLDLSVDGRVVMPRDRLHVLRTVFLWQGCCYTRVVVKNFAHTFCEVDLVVRFAADFADMFEVRGQKRPRRGETLDPVVGDDHVVLGYQGLDEVVRQTRLEMCPAPHQISASEMRFVAGLQPHESVTLDLTIVCDLPGSQVSPLSYAQAYADLEDEWRRTMQRSCVITTSNDQFNVVLTRAWADLHMLGTETPYGVYPYGGVPWFSTPFGRDGLITALSMLWIDPSIARAVLSFLAATQATEVLPDRDAEPGKILHEARQGEMAALGEIPFGQYYGSVDATPLFVMLASDYYERTGDRAFLESLWPHIERALAWIDTYGDRDGDGFVEYARQTPHGLAHQGWKDSYDSVFHADGQLAKGPIALCEVQGYVYAAKRGAAHLASMLGRAAQAAALHQAAQALQERFEQAFWCEELGTYALALDGAKQPCCVRTSNAGQTLYTGIAHPERARRVAETLFTDEGFCGWGIRTVASSERSYNPMSYHNGSVWPHDNAFIAAGLARYGFTELVIKVLTGLFEASHAMELHRLPELFCGFARHPGGTPTLYPVACAPQAWASASLFWLIQSCLGMSFRQAARQLLFKAPLLPPFIQELRLTNLAVGNATVDLVFHRHPEDVGINVARRDGDVYIVTEK
jgi:glycogen debranching enzyme